MEARLSALRAHARQRETQPFTIFRVPAYVRESNRTAYEPRVVSIGPYYHGSPSLRTMEDHKWRNLEHMQSEFKLSAATLIEEMRSLEPRARACYSETPQLSSDEFVPMLVLDGCFIIMFFYHKSKPDALLDVSWGRTLINTDLLLLENQIPFFVLEKLAKSVAKNSHNKSFGKRESLMNMLLAFSTEEPIARPSAKWKIHHLLHLYYERFVPMHPRVQGAAAAGLLPTTAVDRGMYAKGSEEAPASSSVTVDIEQPKEEAAAVTIDDDEDDFPMVVQAASVTVDIEQPEEETAAVTIDDDDDDFPMVVQAASVTVDIEQPVVQAAAVTIDDNDASRMLRRREPQLLAASLAVDMGRQPKEGTAATRGIPCAKEMSAAGVTFVRPKERRHMYDVRFDGRRGVMEIPAILVDDMTRRPLLMNLIAFEQTKGKGSRKRVVTSYVALMSMLIRRENDVELLRRLEILDNLLADDHEAARFFSHLGDCIAMDYSNQLFTKLYKGVQVYCRSWRHRNRATLMRDYFGSPWSAIAVVIAALLFALTVTQTYFTVFPAKN